MNLMTLILVFKEIMVCRLNVSNDHLIYHHLVDINIHQPNTFKFNRTIYIITYPLTYQPIQTRQSCFSTLENNSYPSTSSQFRVFNF